MGTNGARVSTWSMGPVVSPDFAASTFPPPLGTLSLAQQSCSASLLGVWVGTQSVLSWGMLTAVSLGRPEEVISKDCANISFTCERLLPHTKRLRARN